MLPLLFVLMLFFFLTYKKTPAMRQVLKRASLSRHYLNMTSLYLLLSGFESGHIIGAGVKYGLDTYIPQFAYTLGIILILLCFPLSFIVVKKHVANISNLRICSLLLTGLIVGITYGYYISYLASFNFYTSPFSPHSGLKVFSTFTFYSLLWSFPLWFWITMIGLEKATPQKSHAPNHLTIRKQKHS